MKILITLGLGLIAGAAVAQGSLIAIDSSGAIVELSSTTGARTPLSTLSGAANIAALAYDRQLDIMWGASLANDSLYTINYNTGVATLVGAFNAGHDVVSHGLEYVNSTGTLYMASALTGTFYSVNKATAQATLVGTHAITQNTSLGWNMTNNTMYAVNSQTDSLYTVNIASGAMTLVGALGAGTILPNSLAFNHDTNIMYMTDTSTDNLYTLDLVTGAASLVGSTGVGNLQGMVYVNPVPEPATVVSVGIGLAVLIGLRRKRA